ncbi:Type IV pilin PilA [Chondromyces apiculatus DSM 436]|uniref:Type IV pilin PilA n=2 Tax=Chondromyces apiculatus TaxID=51 RepID=A0A017T369_9BACT|nr:Type IV pilin PilA [Chondromyces apiculatus DSM 436]
MRAFTLVELMIVVAIIGVLAALAVVGVRRYLSASRIAEAKGTVGAIARSAALAYDQERNISEIPSSGGIYIANTHRLCTSATPVPANINQVQGTKYQPDNAVNSDFGTGSSLVGWLCLGFSINEPVHFQYHYNAGGGYLSSGLTGAPVPSEDDAFEAAAQGDLDGDGNVSTFARVGEVQNGNVTMSTSIFIHNESE